VRRRLQEWASNSAIVVGGGNFIRGATFAEDGAHQAGPRPTTWACSPTVHQRPGFAGKRWKSSGPAHPRAVGDQRLQASASRSLSAAARSGTSKRGAAVILAARPPANPFFTTDTCAALRAHRARGRRAAEGHQGRRHLRQRPQEEPPPPSSTTRSPTRRCTRNSSGVMDPHRQSPSVWSGRSRSVVFNLKTEGNINRVLMGRGTSANPDRAGLERTAQQARRSPSRSPPPISPKILRK